MADSDGEYQANLSDDEEALQEASGYGTRAKGKGRADGRAKQAWEASAQKSYGTLREGADGRIAGLEQVEEERKRKRFVDDFPLILFCAPEIVNEVPCAQMRKRKMSKSWGAS